MKILATYRDNEYIYQSCFDNEYDSLKLIIEGKEIVLLNTLSFENPVAISEETKESIKRLYIL